MTNFPKRVADKIQAYQDKKGSLNEAEQKISAKIHELETEVAKIKADLKKVVDDAINGANDEISDGEKRLRQQLIEKEMSLAAYRDRLRHVPTFKGQELAVEAVQAAREHAQEKYQKDSAKKLAAIENAKTAYLQAIADYSVFHSELAGLAREAARATEIRALERVSNASIPEIAWNYRQALDSDGNKYTIFSDEANYALNNGEVKRFSRA